MTFSNITDQVLGAMIRKLLPKMLQPLFHYLDLNILLNSFLSTYIGAEISFSVISWQFLEFILYLIIHGTILEVHFSLSMYYNIKKQEMRAKH